MDHLLIVIGKFIAFLSKALNQGSGSTWPGHIALLLSKNFIKNLHQKNNHLKIIVIAGTNGKTTTGKLIQTILEHDGKKVFQNNTGANLLNGLASSFLLHATLSGHIPYDYAVFEVDENTVPLALSEFTPKFVIILNLFRDQLDRYGETDAVAKKWNIALQTLSSPTTVILNADDPQIAYLGVSQKATVLYFGLDETQQKKKKLSHAVDSVYCPKCGTKLYFKSISFSHLGNWECRKCNLKRPRLSISYSGIMPFPGLYNRYNMLAALLCAQQLHISDNIVISALNDFIPAFGRQEKILLQGKEIQLFLSKNPTSMNESLRTINELKAKHVLLILNDRIPDGRDVSWIWDVDFEEFLDKSIRITISGERAYDMGLRMKYADSPNSHFQIEKDLKKAIHMSLANASNETLYILPTYSAMLEARKILLGRKIL